MTPRTNKAPKHLDELTGKWWESVVDGYELEAHHVRILTHACESWDAAEQARRALATHGQTYVDRFGQPRARPEIAIARDGRTQFSRLVRELCLDDTEPEDQRPPRGR